MSELIHPVSRVNSEIQQARTLVRVLENDEKVKDESKEKAREDRNKLYVATIFTLLQGINPTTIRAIGREQHTTMWGQITIGGLLFFFEANKLPQQRPLSVEMQSIIKPGIMHELTTSWWVHKPYKPTEFTPKFDSETDGAMEDGVNSVRSELITSLLKQGHMKEGESLTEVFKKLDKAYANFFTAYDGAEVFRELYGCAVSLACNEKAEVHHVISSHNTHHGRMVRDWMRTHHIGPHRS